MARLRVVSVVEDTWGKSVVYGDENEPSIQQNCDSTPENITTESKILIHEINKDDAFAERENEEVQKEINYCSLTYLQASLYATILEDTIMEVRILVECNNELRVSKTEIDMGLLLALKFEVAQPKTTDELDGIDPRHLGCDDYKLNKLDSDRKYLTKVIVAAYKEISLYKTFENLQEYVYIITKTEYYRLDLMADETKNKILRRELNKQLRQQRNHFKSVIYDADATTDVLRSKVEDASLNAEIRSRYVENWQLARTEQHLQTISETEVPSSNTIEYYKQRADYEQRVHSEIELLTNISINETLEKIDNWMNKYDKDMENLDLKIQIKKNDYQNMLDRRIDLENTIEKHDIMMKEWIHFKEEREKARLYREKMTNSAIVVQAWWRGLLVRRGLGPYKADKKKGGDKKKK